MEGEYSKVARAVEDLKAGRITPEQATEVRLMAEARVAALKARRHQAYADEIAEISVQLDRLQAVLHVRPDAPVICIFSRPERWVEKMTLDPYTDDEQLMRHRLPAVSVIRIGQVPFIELDGRMRVRDWYELMLDGAPCSPPVEGPKRWIMKNAQGAAMMDHTGKLPGWILLTGRARQKSRYQRRHVHGRPRNRRRRKLFLIRMKGVIVPAIVKSVFKDAMYPRLLTRVPVDSPLIPRRYQGASIRLKVTNKDGTTNEPVTDAMNSLGRPRSRGRR